MKTILSKSFLCAVILLLVNDHFLKDAYPGWLSGKLSDFAGLYAVAIVAGIVFPRNKLGLIFFLGLAFVYWKTPLSDSFISTLNLFLPWSISRVVDYSDFLALFVLPIALFVPPVSADRIENPMPRFASVVVLACSIFAFLGTSMSPPKYVLDYRKSVFSTYEIDPYVDFTIPLTLAQLSSRLRQMGYSMYDGFSIDPPWGTMHTIFAEDRCCDGPPLAHDCHRFWSAKIKVYQMGSVTRLQVRRVKVCDGPDRKGEAHAVALFKRLVIDKL